MKAGKATAKRSDAGSTPRSTQPFDPTAYAALIAMSAAEQRLRASHSRDGSSSTARPSSVRRPSAAPLQGAGPSPPFSSNSQARREGRTVEDIIARHRSRVAAAPPSSSSLWAPTAAMGERGATELASRAPPAAQPRTLLEELACGSETTSSTGSVAPSSSRGVHEAVTAVELSAERADSPDTKARRPSFSPPPVRAASSPPASEPLPAAPLACLRQGGEGARVPSLPEAADASVLLRDASPLRERSVAGASQLSYRVLTAECVHTVAQQLNFALYQ